MTYIYVWATLTIINNHTFYVAWSTIWKVSRSNYMFLTQNWLMFVFLIIIKMNYY